VLGHITGPHKYRDLVLQVGGWTQGLRACSVKKKITAAKSKEVKADQIWQNLLRLWLKDGSSDDVFFIDALFADDHILLTKNEDDLQYSGYNLNNKSA
jgi:hypothetical protein